jgi:hypothetical protein
MLVLSGFVGSSFLAFRRLFLGLRAFIEILLDALSWFGSALHPTSARTPTYMQAARQSQGLINSFRIIRPRRPPGRSVVAARLNSQRSVEILISCFRVLSRRTIWV